MKQLVIIFVLVAAVLLVGCSQEGAAPAAAQTHTIAPPTLPPDVQRVADAIGQTAKPAAETVTPIDEKYSATGEFISPSRSEVAPKIPGRVAAVYVDEGAFVRRGQPLLAFETDYARLEAQRAQAELARANAAADEARRDFQRKQELRAKESVPQATFDRSQAAWQQAEASRSAASATLALANQRLQDSTVVSPITGAVAERRVDVGEHVPEGGVTFVVVQTAPLKLRFGIPERFVARVRPGQTIAAKVDAYPNEVFSGTIRTVGGVVNPETRTIFAEAEFANRDGRLRPGLFARVELDLN